MVRLGSRPQFQYRALLRQTSSKRGLLRDMVAKAKQQEQSQSGISKQASVATVENETVCLLHQAEQKIDLKSFSSTCLFVQLNTQPNKVMFGPKVLPRYVSPGHPFQTTADIEILRRRPSRRLRRYPPTPCSA
ncbi:hypothetical protein HUJ05_009953 [Dendroctonus ponderosae]|nr:hypothetical protein HUJ05_009953 [Dendroctonus ponderosae]